MTNSAHSASIPPESIREAVERICADAIFAGSPALKAFLVFTVDHRLRNQADPKEYVIATAVFGRNASFDPAHSSIVRTQAVRLRAKLREYYATSGRAENVVIKFQAGKYRPDFEWARGDDSKSGSESDSRPASNKDLPPSAGLSRGRQGLVQKLTAAQRSIAESVAGQLPPGKQEPSLRYGQVERQLWTDDVERHLGFLAGAIESGSRESFADYVQWAARKLRARGIASNRVEQMFGAILTQLAAVLSPSEYVEAASFFECAKGACAGPGAPVECQPGKAGLKLTHDLFLAAILRGDKHAAENVANEAVNAGYSHLDLYVDVLGASLNRVGTLWELNQITVAQEHAATAVAQYVIASLYHSMVPVGPPGGNMLVTCSSGELHQIGANMLADAMESKGWNVRFLGSDTPDEAVLQAIEESRADVACISTTLVSNIPAAAQLVRAIRDRGFARDLRIVLGGAAYRHSPGFPAQLGVLSGGMDLRQAIHRLCP